MTAAYKVLGTRQESHHGGSGRWVKNRWRTVDGPLIPCENGIHYCSRDQLRGCRAVLDAEPEFRWVVCEMEPPYAVSVVSLAPDALALADAKVDHALNVWFRCLETDEWPGYPRAVCYAEAPGWMEADWLEKEAREAA